MRRMSGKFEDIKKGLKRGIHMQQKAFSVEREERERERERDRNETKERRPQIKKRGCTFRSTRGKSNGGKRDDHRQRQTIKNDF